jgi:CheY-like chemotaxis protein
MDERAVMLRPEENELEPRIRLLVADGDPSSRSLLVSRAREAVGEIVVFEAVDGAEAIQLGLQHDPAIGLLAVEMPRLGGIEAATTLRELRPRMRLALRSRNPYRDREPVTAHELPLFSERELGHALAWLRAQAAWYTTTPTSSQAPAKISLSCTRCGYGVLRSTPPERCPMCQSANAWIASSRRLATPVLTRA